MKIIAIGILQKLLKYWTIRRRNDCPSKPATQRIILEIDWFMVWLYFKIKSVSLKRTHFIQITTYIKCVRFCETDVTYILDIILRVKRIYWKIYLFFSTKRIYWLIYPFCQIWPNCQIVYYVLNKMCFMKA